MSKTRLSADDLAVALDQVDGENQRLRVRLREPEHYVGKLRPAKPWSEVSDLLGRIDAALTTDQPTVKSESP